MTASAAFSGIGLNTRARAARLLCQTLPLNRQNLQPRSLSDLLTEVDDEEKDRGLLQELCFGVCRWYTRLDKLAAPLVRQPFKPRDADLHALLLVGLYQLLYLRVPDHAAISETVEACRQFDKPWAVKVINGMLRQAQRRKGELEQQLPDNLPIQTAHPKWLVDALSSAWPQQYQRLLTANNEPGPLCLRVNLRRQNRAQYLQQLAAKNIRARVGEWSDAAIYLEQAQDVENLPGFADGAVSVQDEAAQLSAALLDAQPGDVVLDACAAPGGKTGHILERQPELGHLVALDADARRLQRVQDNLQRLQLCAELVHSDLESYATHTEQRFDRILLDAPCSATGVIRRHPDIKWLRKRNDIRQLAETQLRLLKAAFDLLKPGGTLLYATCSVLPQENNRVIQAFLAQQMLSQPESMQEIKITAEWGIDAGTGRQLFATANSHDGFYYARLQRAESC